MWVARMCACHAEGIKAKDARGCHMLPTTQNNCGCMWPVQVGAVYWIARRELKGHEMRSMLAPLVQNPKYSVYMR